MAINTGTPSYSSTAGFILDLDALIEEAFERCGLQDRTGYELKTSRRSINLMIAEWANRGLNLWTIQLKTQTLTASTSSYDLGTDIVDIVSAVVYKASDTTVDIYFKPQLSDTGGVPGAIINDKVQLTVKTAKRKEVMKALAEATNQGPHSDGITIIADDYATTYLTSDITAVASITVASQV